MFAATLIPGELRARGDDDDTFNTPRYVQYGDDDDHGMH